MERTQCSSSTNFSTSTVRSSSCRRSIATNRGTAVSSLLMLAVYTPRPCLLPISSQLPVPTVPFWDSTQNIHHFSFGSVIFQLVGDSIAESDLSGNNMVGVAVQSLPQGSRKSPRYSGSRPTARPPPNRHSDQLF